MSDAAAENLDGTGENAAQGDGGAVALQDFVGKMQEAWAAGVGSASRSEEAAATQAAEDVVADKKDSNAISTTPKDRLQTFWAKLRSPDTWSELAERAAKQSLDQFGVDKDQNRQLESALWSMKAGEKKEDNFFLLMGKLKLTLDHAQELLGKDLKLSPTQALRSMSFLMGCCEAYIAENATAIETLAREDGAKEAEKDLLIELDRNMEFANAAYDEFDPDETMFEFFARREYTLMYYDSATDYEMAAHYVAFSPAKKRCVVGIKGTSTLSDMLTDILCRSTPFVDDETFAHDGIKITAQRVAARVEPFLLNLFAPLNYEILFTGHSLGAGVAALVAVIFREAHKVSKVRALAYACPPVLDKKAALRTYEYVTSVVNNRDIIPRTSLSNMNIMNEALARAHDLIQAGELDSAAPAANGERVLRMMREVQEEAKLAYDQDLYVPGRVLYMFSPNTKTRCALEKTGDLANLRQMLFTKSMVLDHSMDNYMYELRNTLFDLHKLHSITSPPVMPDTEGALVSIVDYIQVFSPADMRDVVFYVIKTTVAHSPDRVREYEAYRRFTDFERLVEGVRAAGATLLTKLPSRVTVWEPVDRARQFEIYLSALIHKAAYKRLDDVMELVRDFIGVGQRPPAPEFVLDHLAAQKGGAKGYNDVS
ncbi:Sn1-specific diacylglycerol lipase beta [Hondaea fermentalgiana]|uniref:sn-1-specific diacylglycerol lipase n=1 Tax=Hondaea fermentalgiana TaxID=2315210 RepID=A0A2R5GKN9_9STRA|nr:Sn1-specific diacylglycerol lipase beta [Hondaea fermentalgiana]|eukprot:GBG30879.1 Sn1-specific diacylglycerol lipase beta [Hondaea fermentalgiana]